MTRGGTSREADAGGSMRKCIATGRSLPREELLRFVVGPDGAIVPDVLGKLPGRGIWVSPDRAALEKAAKKNLFARAAKTQVTVPEALVDQVEALLARRIVDLIALARKSGRAVAGYERVKEWLMKDQVAVLLQSSDGSERGKSKLSTPRGGKFVGWLTAAELGLAFGRQTVVHGALGAGGLAPRVVEEAARLKGLRAADGGNARRKGM